LLVKKPKLVAWKICVCVLYEYILIRKVQSYKYPGSFVNSNNSIEEEIQHRITFGNKAYANQFLVKSRLVSKISKLKLYTSIIRPTVTYACETWVLKRNNKKQTDGM
jgi:hypothetical protein